MKRIFTLLILVLPFGVFSQQKVFDITHYGAKADGVTNNTQSIQKAIDEANAQGGGTVYIPAGKFMTGVIYLKSNITLHLADNAVLLASARRLDYGSGYASPVIVANGQQNIAITGKGIIDGNGPALLKDIYRMLRAGTLRDSLWQKYNPWHQKQPEEPNRPKIIRFADCSNIRIKGVIIKDGVDWVQEYKNCSNMVIDSIKVISNVFWNNDGIDLVDCKNVVLTNSFFNADDDGICLKSSDRNSRCENIFVSDCVVRSSASAIKFGTASRGGFKNINITKVKIYDTYRSAVALEVVDGGKIENVNISDINATNVGNAIFIRIGHRNRDTVMSSIKGIHISNLTAQIAKGKPDKGYPMEGPAVTTPHNIFPSAIAGLPGHPVRDVLLENIHITYNGSASKKRAEVSLDALDAIPENPSDYPEFSMFDEIPAWGFYSRHAAGITFKNVTLSCMGTDYRQVMVFDDVANLNLDGITVPQITGKPGIVLHKTENPAIQNIKIGEETKNNVVVK